MRIVNVVGARPNMMKIAPLIAEMRTYPDIEPVLVHTGQHYDANMSKIFFEDLGIPRPDYNLGIGSGSHTWQTTQVMLALESLFQELKPDIVLVVGDVNSTLAAALVASKLLLPLAHVEAGLRSFDRTMPEEVNRIITDALSDYLFTTECSANENLLREGIAREKIFFAGNVMIDTLLQHRQRAVDLNMPARYGFSAGEYGLVTLHRPANVDRPEVLRGLLQALEIISAEAPLLFPIHPRTHNRLQEMDLLEYVAGLPNLHLLQPLGYLEFLGLMAQARLVLTDSGGIQEETTILGVPCLTLRQNTERPITMTQGTNRLVGIVPEKIITAAWDILQTEDNCNSHSQPDLWDGHASRRIIATLRKNGRKAELF